jgi:hypothetical protein
MMTFLSLLWFLLFIDDVSIVEVTGGKLYDMTYKKKFGKLNSDPRID